MCIKSLIYWERERKLVALVRFTKAFELPGTGYNTSESDCARLECLHFEETPPRTTDHKASTMRSWFLHWLDKRLLRKITGHFYFSVCKLSRIEDPPIPRARILHRIHLPYLSHLHLHLSTPPLSQIRARLDCTLVLILLQGNVNVAFEQVSFC